MFDYPAPFGSNKRKAWRAYFKYLQERYRNRKVLAKPWYAVRVPRPDPREVRRAQEARRKQTEVVP